MESELLFSTYEQVVLIGHVGFGRLHHPSGVLLVKLLLVDFGIVVDHALDVRLVEHVLQHGGADLVLVDRRLRLVPRLAREPFLQ